MTRRLASIDVARGVAMVAIVCGHFGILTLNRVVYTFHVPLFLLISGYLLSTRKSPAEFARQRAVQMLRAYAVGAAMLFTGALVVGFVMRYDMAEWLGNTVRAIAFGSGVAHDPGLLPFAMPAVGLLWYLLGALWAMLLARLLAELPTPAGLALAAVAFLAGWKSPALVGWLPWSIQPGLMGTLFVYLGFIAKQHDLLGRKRPAWPLIPAAALWAFCMWRDWAVNIVAAEVGGHGVAVLGSLAGCYVIICASEWLVAHPNPLARAANWYGQLTLAAMLWHAVQDYAFPQWVFYDALGAYAHPERWQLAHAAIVLAALAWTVLGVLVTLRVPALMRVLGIAEPLPLPDPAAGEGALMGAPTNGPEAVPLSADAPRRVPTGVSATGEGVPAHGTPAHPDPAAREGA